VTGVGVTDRRADFARRTGLEGHYAGIVTRFAAFVIDVVTVIALFTLGGHVVEYILTVLLRDQVRLSEAPVVSAVALATWVFFYFAYPLAASGRTFGMAAMGVRVVRADGSDLGARRAVVRVLALPFSFLLLGFGLLLIVLRRDRRALHDLVAGSAVVYSWDARAARLRFLARS
jgi:uncharacterized RDD family membrane protein YckC